MRQADDRASNRVPNTEPSRQLAASFSCNPRSWRRGSARGRAIFICSALTGLLSTPLSLPARLSLPVFAFVPSLPLAWIGPFSKGYAFRGQGQATRLTLRLYGTLTVCSASSAPSAKPDYFSHCKGSRAFFDVLKDIEPICSLGGEKGCDGSVFNRRRIRQT